MNLRSQLRLRHSKQIILEQAQHGYTGRKIVEMLHGVRYLQLHLVDESDQSATAFFDVDLWLNKMDKHLPGIPWQQVPRGYLARWLNTLGLSFFIEDKIWNVEEISLPEQQLPRKLLSLVAEPCAIYCNDWPIQATTESRIGISLELIPLRLRYVLGKTQLPLSELVSLVSGDLLIIRDTESYLAIGQYNLFNFSYQGNDDIMVKEPVFNNQEVECQEEGHLLDWTKLPVELEFVLDSNTITLGELNDISIGNILSVNTGSEQKVKIYLNRKFFAVGELVALEEGGLAVEVHQINIQQNRKLSEPDAE